MELNRKEFIKSAALAGVGLMTPSLISEAFGKPFAGNFELPPLGYGFDALEPFIDAQTMQIHHVKHHQAYITKLNEAVKSETQLAGKSLENLIGSINTLPEKVQMAVRNHGGGHWNHSFFWKILKPGTQLNGTLKESINRDFGSLENFQAAFEKAANGQFGSGWAWLISNQGKLSITGTPNQDNPLMDLASVKGKPVIGIDVWEHAYYLKYQNRRGEYTKAFWNIVNWEQAEKNYNTL
jgi:Fe-Mn family superoxide dismutase